MTPNMLALTKQQQQTLIEIITEKFGSDLPHDEFVDQLMMLFEDVAGMECVDDGALRLMTDNLWRRYHGSSSSEG